jgi:hypothetical protein
MHKSLFAAAIAAASLGLALPAGAITFPGLTTIYVGSGAFDDGSAAETGTATFITCSNVSGLTASVRILILGSGGGIEGQRTFNNVAHSESLFAATHGVAFFPDLSLSTGVFFGGVINIESTQSGVFCTAMIMAAAGPVENAVPLRLVRVNAHPGTEE